MESIVKLIDNLVLVWHKVLIYGLKPFYAVDREDFIRKKFAATHSPDEVEAMIASSPYFVVDARQLRRIVMRMILNQSMIVSLITFVLSLPQGGWLSWLCLVLDFAQFQMFVFALTKKILYCYEPVVGGEGDEDREEVMFWADRITPLGVRIERFIASFIGFAVNNAIKTAARKFVVRLFAFNVAKSVAKYIGASLSNEYFDIGFDCFVVFVTCLVCAFVSWILFAPMMQRFAGNLRKRKEETVGKKEECERMN